MNDTEDDIYSNWRMPANSTNKQIIASIAKIDAILSIEPKIWHLNESQRNAVGTDWKADRVNRFCRIMQFKEDIEPPEFYIREQTKQIWILDGRHRTYAAHREGHKRIVIQCKPQCYEIIKAAIGA